MPPFRLTASYEHDYYGTAEPRGQRYKRQTDASFAALGRYVQSYEQMVAKLRSACEFMIGGRPGMIQAVLHHPVFTARPLVDVYCSIVMKTIQLLSDRIPANDLAIAKSLLKHISGSIGEASGIRNKMLHGTWYIGWASEADKDFSDAPSYKGKHGKDGYSYEQVSTDANSIDIQTAECDRITRLISKFSGCIDIMLVNEKEKCIIALNIFCVNGKWSTSMPPWTCRTSPESA